MPCLSLSSRHRPRSSRMTLPARSSCTRDLTRLPPSAPLSLDLDTLPERDTSGDLFCRVLGLRVIPCGVVIELAVDEHVVIAGGALPRTEGVCVARLQVLPAYRVLREVDVPFHHLDTLGGSLRDHGTVPNSTRHAVSLPD